MNHLEAGAEWVSEAQGQEAANGLGAAGRDCGAAVRWEVAILSRRLGIAWQGEEWPGARRQHRTAVLGMALRASQGGKWGLFLGCRRSCGGEAGTRKALAGRGRGSTGRYRRVLFQLAEYPACNKGTVRLPIPPTSVLAALRGSPAKFGFWISKFRANKLGERRSGEEGS